MAFAYDESAKKAYFVEQDGNLRYLNPYGTTAEGSGYASGADQIYRIVFGKRFYS